MPGQKSSPKYHSLKVMQARLDTNGKRVTFDKGEVAYIEITESSANVTYISQEIQQLWGNNYRIATSDGMEVKDCSGTQGNLVEYLICIHLTIYVPFGFIKEVAIAIYSFDLLA